MGLNNHMELEEEWSPEFWLFIPVKLSQLLI